MPALYEYLVSQLRLIPFVQCLRAREAEGVHDFLVVVSTDLYLAETKIIPIFMDALQKFVDVKIEFMICNGQDLSSQGIEAWGDPLILNPVAQP